MLYKLVDKKCKEYADNGIISFIRPCLEFSKGEGNAFDFIKDINDIVNNYNDISSILIDEKVIKKIDNWFSTYLEILSLEDNISNRKIYFSDFEIMLYMYLNTYCASFTKTNFSNCETRKEFIEKNKKFIKKYNKIAYICIDLNKNNFEVPVFGKKKCDSLIFSYNKEKIDYINGYLHIHDIDYIENPNEKEILSRFNKNRKVSELFRYLTSDWKKQMKKEYF